jgi:NADP+-dependent farnesol dehydrogenase
MDLSRWHGCVAVVTGASAGIGASICLELVKHNFVTIGFARRVERIEELKKNLEPEQRRRLHAIKCDVSNENEVIGAFAEVVKKFDGVDVLINNAGVLPQKSLTDPLNSDDMRRVMDTNLMGVIYCTREAVKSMRLRYFQGHIIHINSVAGHSMAFNKDFPNMGIYHASKYAVTALAEQHRQEFMKEKLDIKVTVSFENVTVR